MARLRAPRLAQVRAAAQVVTDSAGDAAHVGVVAVYRGLHQRRIGHRLGHRHRVLLLQAGAHGYLDHVAGTLAVADDVACQLDADPLQGSAQPGHRGAAGGAFAGTEQHHHVARALVAVHGDTVERAARRPPQLALQLIGAGGSIGDDERQHGGEVGLDHPRALGDAEHAVAGRGPCAAQLGVGIGGHDGACHRQRGRRVEAGGQGGHGGPQGSHRKLPADHPGRGGQQFVRRHPEGGSGPVQQGACGRHAVARAHVGYLVVDQDAAYRPPAMAAHDLHRCAGDAIAGQNRGPGTARGRGQDRRQIDRQRTGAGAQLDRGEVGGGNRKAESMRDQGALLQGLTIAVRRTVDLSRCCHRPPYSTVRRTETTICSAECLH